MNWTGGRLSRHTRNANGSLNQRQKQHFAKTRSNLLNGPPKRSPMRWSIFDKDDRAAWREGPKLYTAPRLTQTSQPDFSPNDEGISKKRHRSENSPKPTLPKATGGVAKESGHDRESSRELLSHAGSDRGFHKEAMPSLNLKTGKQQAPTVEIADDVNIDDEADSFEERRRRILRRIDWVGANIQHPIKLRFTATGNDERLGKRRRITAHHQNQLGAVAQPMIRSPFAMPRPKQKPHGSPGAQSANGKNIEALPRNHVSISIGGRHVMAGVASSTSYSKTVGGRFASSQASIPDEMLLDGDDISRQHRQLPQERQWNLSRHASPPLVASTLVGNAPTCSASPRDLTLRTPHRKQVLSSYGRSNGAIDRVNAASCADLECRIATSRTGEGIFTLDVAQHLDQRVSDLVNPSNQQVRFVTRSHSNLVTLRSRSVRNLPDTTSRMHADVTQGLDQGIDPESFPSSARYITGVSKQLSESARKLQSVARDKSRRNARLDSQPELLHPIPLTSRTSRVLCSTSSEAGSNVAQVNMKPIATQSQMLDEEIWKTWVLSSLTSLSNESNSGVYDNLSISPGISNYGHGYVQENLRNEIERDENELEMSQAVSGPDYASDQELEQSTGESPTDVENEEIHRGILPSLQERVRHEDSPPTRPVVDYKSLFLSRARKLPTPPKPKPVRVANPDEAWMKFILSDNDDDDEEDDMQPLSLRQVMSPVPIKSRPSSSMIAHVSAKTASSSQPELTISSVIAPNTTLDNVNLNTTISSIDRSEISNHTTQSSIPSSSDGLSHQPSSIDRIRTEPASSFSTFSRPIRKLTFTKPPRFQVPNRGSSPETTAATAGSPVHIGQAFSLAKLRDAGVGKKRDVRSDLERSKQQERDIYSFKSEDDVESIEDD